MDDDRLKGWKEIAGFLHVRERTAQRWEHALGLPVHRVETARSAIVFASRVELNAWLQTADGHKARSEEPTAAHATVTPAPEDVEAVGGPSGQVLVGSRVSDVNGAGLQGDADLAAIDADFSPQPSRSSVAIRRPPRTFLLAAGILVVAAAAVALIYVHSRYARTPIPTHPAGAPSPTATLRLTLSDGRTVNIKQRVGVPTTIALGPGAPYTLTAEPIAGGMRIFVYRTKRTPTPGSNDPLEELGAVSLKPGTKERLSPAGDIATIEWVNRPPGS